MRFLQKLLGNTVKLVSEMRENRIIFLQYFICMPWLTLTRLLKLRIFKKKSSKKNNFHSLFFVRQIQKLLLYKIFCLFCAYFFVLFVNIPNTYKALISVQWRGIFTVFFMLRWKGDSYISETILELSFISSLLRSPSEVLIERLLVIIFVNEGRILCFCQQK